MTDGARKLNQPTLPTLPRWISWARLGGSLLALSGLALTLAFAPLKPLAAAFFAAGAIIAVLRQPALGLSLVGLAIPFGSLVPLPIPGVNLVDLLVGLAIVAWLAQGLVRKKLVRHGTPLLLPLLIFVWCAALSLTQAFSWRDGLGEWLKWAEFAALYFVAVQVLDRRTAAWTLGALAAAGMVEVAHGAYQFFRQVGPEAFILQGRFMRAYGAFQQPNPYAGYLGYLFPVAASLAVAGALAWWRRRRASDLVLAVTAAIAAAALTIGIILSWSRGAWLGLAAAAVVVIGMRTRRTALTVGLGILILLLAISVAGTGWLPAPIVGRLGDLGSYLGGSDPVRTEISDANFSVLERVAHWQAGLRMFSAHPWLGVGIGNFGAVYPNYALPHWYVSLGHAHNAFINFLAETGVIGFGAFLAFWLGVGREAWRGARRRRGYTAALALGLLGTWSYLTVHNQFDNLFVQHLQLQLALLLGVLMAFIRTGAQTDFDQ